MNQKISLKLLFYTTPKSWLIKATFSITFDGPALPLWYNRQVPVPDFRNRQVSDARKALVKLLYIRTDLSNKEIAIKLGIGQSTVTNILNGRYKNEECISKLIEKIKSQMEL